MQKALKFKDFISKRKADTDMALSRHISIIRSDVYAHYYYIIDTKTALL